MEVEKATPMATSLTKLFFFLFLALELFANNVLGRPSWMETDDCVSACSLHQKTIGISSESSLNQAFLHRLCSPECYLNCPNTVNVYFSAAAGDGVFLPNLCQLKGFRRKILETVSVASAPVISNLNGHVIYLDPPVPGANF